jgi:hypothetical protein
MLKNLNYNPNAEFLTTIARLFYILFLPLSGLLADGFAAMQPPTTCTKL